MSFLFLPFFQSLFIFFIYFIFSLFCLLYFFLLFFVYFIYVLLFFFLSSFFSFPFCLRFCLFYVCPLFCLFYILSILSMSSFLSILSLSCYFITLFLFLPSLSSSPSFTAGSREDNKSRCGTQQFPARTLSDAVACVFDLSTPTKRSWTRKDMSRHVGKSCAEKNKHMEDVLCVT